MTATASTPFTITLTAEQVAQWKRDRSSLLKDAREESFWADPIDGAVESFCSLTGLDEKHDDVELHVLIAAVRQALGPAAARKAKA